MKHILGAWTPRPWKCDGALTKFFPRAKGPPKFGLRFINSPHYVVFPLWGNNQNTGYLLNIMMIFDRCRRSWAAVTPVKYERDWNAPAHIVANKNKFVHSEKNNERIFSAPTSGLTNSNLFSLFINAGLGIDEGVTAKAVNVQDKPGHLSLCMVEEVSGSIAALASIFPCPLARSTRPVTASGYIVFRPDCQDQGLLATLFPACARIMPGLGYIGLCARAQWPAGMYLILSLLWGIVLRGLKV